MVEMKNFTLLKMNRAVWVSLLRQQKILEAVSYFESYLNSLMMIQSDKRFKEEVAEELAYSQAFFLTKLSAIAEKYFKDKDCLLYTSDAADE